MDNARHRHGRCGPARVARHQGRCGGDRLRPVAGQPCAAAASARRACVRRTRAKLPPRNGETLVTLAANDRSPRPSYFPGCSRLPGSLAPAVRCGAPEVRP
jgi:hypothetical protein